MINLWDYARGRPRVRITRKSGSIVQGKTIGVFDAEELDDDEDAIGIDLDGGGADTVYLSEIAKIERI
jgi:hypothetical protein